MSDLPPHNAAHVELSDVGVSYRNGDAPLQACSGISFAVEPGESVVLIGPSGCGKSTVLHVVAGLLAPTEGQVRVAGEPLRGPRPETAFIPQDLGIFPWKTVLQNAALGLRLHGVPRQEAIRQATESLSRVGLEGFESAYPKDLSGGMRQRLALARALVMEADLVLMDEPLSAIDALQRESLQDALLDFWRTRGHAQILVTHSIEEAVYLGQRIVVFSARPGTIVAQIDNPEAGTPEWRDSEAYARRCQQVRAVLRGEAR